MRKRRSALAIFCAEALEEEKERKRRLRRSAQKELCIPYSEYNKDEVPVDVATSLVVNHVNPGALCMYVVSVFMIMLSTVIMKSIYNR